MTFSTGTRLGPYEILSPLGAGGMGEVYRAKDTRLDREVAVKVIHPRFAADADQLRRFEQEARAASQLNHPNILVVHDVGSHEGGPYIVSELLDGESLREKLGAPLPPKKAVEYAVQVANGLAAAHEKGIVHRDLKPENLFVTKDGRLKILDFGVAKLTQPAIPSISLTEAPTAAPATDAGVVLGTVGYMSPEQVLGKPLDSRTDLFSLGVVLYEMLSGKRPFQRQTAPETMAAILREDPPELSGTNKPIPPSLERIVRHCLEKEPSGRFQSARDVVFDLESLSQISTGGTAPLRTAGRKRRLAIGALILPLLAASGAGLFLWGKKAGTAPVPSFKRVTFRRGTVWSARFTPDFQSVVYSAAWEGRPPEVFVQRLASADARPIGFVHDQVVIAGTARGAVAVLRVDSGQLSGTLSHIPLEGGAPRDVLKGVQSAAWDRGGTRFAAVRTVGGRHRLEFPIGRTLVEATGLTQLVKLRLSPDEKRVAYVALPNGFVEPSGDICVVESTGESRILSKGWADTGGAWGNLAWSPDGDEIWFSANREGVGLGLYAVTLTGKERLVARLPGDLILQDISPDGRVLLTHGPTRRIELRGRLAGDTTERDLSWLDGTFSPILSSDGTQMLTQEWGEGGGPEGSTYHWKVDSPTPRRLGGGAPVGASPDWALAYVFVGSSANIELLLMPIGAGEAKRLPRGQIATYYWAAAHPDGKRIVIVGADVEGSTRFFVQNVDGGLPRSFAQVAAPPNPPWFYISADGSCVAARPREGEPYACYPIDGGGSRSIPFLQSDETPLAFGDDGMSIFLTKDSFKVSLQILRLNLRTGRREHWLELTPPNRAGIIASQGPWVTPNGRFYAYSSWRMLSDLFVFERLR